MPLLRDRTSWSDGRKVLVGIPMLVTAYIINTVVAAGACSIIDPPFTMH